MSTAGSGERGEQRGLETEVRALGSHGCVLGTKVHLGNEGLCLAAANRHAAKALMATEVPWVGLSQVMACEQLPSFPEGLSSCNHAGGGLRVRPVQWSGCRSGRTGQQVGLGKLGERERGEACTWAWKTGPGPAACKAAVSVFSELEGLKSHVCLPGEEIETQTHPGLPHRHGSSQVQGLTAGESHKVLEELEFSKE